MDNSEALSIMLKGMDFDAEDLIRVVAALGEIKKKKDEKKEEEGNKFSVVWIDLCVFLINGLKIFI